MNAKIMELSEAQLVKFLKMDSSCMKKLDLTDEYIAARADAYRNSITMINKSMEDHRSRGRKNGALQLLNLIPIGQLIPVKVSPVTGIVK